MLEATLCSVLTLMILKLVVFLGLMSSLLLVQQLDLVPSDENKAYITYTVPREKESQLPVTPITLIVLYCNI